MNSLESVVNLYSDIRIDTWEWIRNNTGPNATYGLCPICGERVLITDECITDNGRIIGSCGDAFTIEQWEDSDE